MGYGESLGSAKSREQYFNEAMVAQSLGEHAMRPPLTLVAEESYNDLSWQDRAKCLSSDGDSFFVEGASQREQAKFCENCPVKNECLEYALANDEEFGVWGGMTSRARRKLKRSLSKLSA